MKQRNFLKYFLVFVGFVIFYTFFYYFEKTTLEKEFLTATSLVPSIRNYGSSGVSQMQNIFHTWGLFIGLGFGLISWFVSLILFGLLKIVRLAKYSWTHLIMLLIVYSAYFAFATELLYYENRFSAMAISIIFFVGYPLYYASIAALVLIFIIYLLPAIFFRIKKIPSSTVNTIILILTLSTMPFFLSGCSLLSGLTSVGCDILSDSTHCPQEVAVSGGEADNCAKVQQPEQFKDVGSNPPQDKCYLMVAQNTGNLDACNKIKGGWMSYTREECILETSIDSENPSGCKLLSGSDREQCIEKLGPKITVEKVLDVDNQIDLIKSELSKGADADLEKQLKGLQDKRKDMVSVMTKSNLTEYNIQSDPLNKQIIGDWAAGNLDDNTKSKLIDTNEKLKKQGLALTNEQYTAVRDYYKFVNDPANDIEKMDDNQIVKDKWNEKIGNVVDKLKFWTVNDTTEEKTEDVQLRFYERMLERQNGIDKNITAKQQAFQDTVGVIAGQASGMAGDKAKDFVIEHIFGEAASTGVSLTTMVLGEAISEVQKQAKSAEFRGLVKAYDNGMAEELPKFGGNVDKAHAAVVDELLKNPYNYTSQTNVQFGNLIENADCDGSNPHCLSKNIFWKAMKKSYKYQHGS